MFFLRDAPSHGDCEGRSISLLKEDSNYFSLLSCLFASLTLSCHRVLHLHEKKKKEPTVFVAKIKVSTNDR